MLLQWFQTQQEMFLEHPFTICILFFSFFFLLRLALLRPEKTIKLPPSPPKLPIIGHLHCLGTLPHRSLRVLSEKYGPLMLLHLGQAPTLVVSSAEMAKEIMKTHDIVFANRPITTASKAFLYGDKDIAFAPYGEYWRQIRKLCIMDLLSVKRVKAFRSVRDEEINSMVSKIENSCRMGKEVNLSELIVAVTNKVIARVAWSRSFQGEAGNSEYIKVVKQTMDLFGFPSMEDMIPSLGWIDKLTGLDRKMKKTSKAFHQFVDEVIEEHRVARKNNDGQADRRDLVDVLLDYEKDPTLGVEITRENVKAILMDMFVAGTDTTFTTLEWAMAELLNHPGVLKKIQEEVRKHIGTKSEVDESVVSKISYLNCVIKETLRLHPPLVMILPRVSTTSTIIEGYTIPSKTRVMINAWAIARDPKIWDKPDQFIPERFLDNLVDFRGQDYEFIPFGAGRRSCPGVSFGLISIESVLANLLYWFDWELPGGGDYRCTDMTEVFGLTVRKKLPLHLVPTLHSF